MEFFRIFEKLLPSYLKENMATATAENNNNITDPSVNQCQGKKMQREGNLSVNSNEYVSTNIDSSVDNVEEFDVTKTLHNLENVSPTEMTTNDIDLEPMEHEKRLIKNAKIFNHASETSSVISEDQYRGSLSDLENNTNILETEGSAKINSNEYVLSNIGSVGIIAEEFSIAKTFHNLENVAPIEMNTNNNTYHEQIKPHNIEFVSAIESTSNDDTDLELMENEKSLIEIARIFSHASETSSVITEDQYRRSLSDLDNNSNILEIEESATVNSNEYILSNIDSVGNIVEEFSVTKTFHDLENVTPIEITTNDNTYQEQIEPHNIENVSAIEITSNDDIDLEPMENDKSLIENARMFKNAPEISSAITDDQFRGSISDLDNNANILETEGSATVNSNEYVLSNIDSVGNIVEGINTNVNNYQEQIENEINFIENIIFNYCTATSLVINNMEDQTLLNKSNNDLAEIKIRHDAEVSHDFPNTDATNNNVLNDETMKSFEDIETPLDIKDKNVFTAEFGTDLIDLDEFKDILDETDAVNKDLVENDFENKANAVNCKAKIYTDINNYLNSNLNENIDIITIDSSSEDEMCQKSDIRDAISISDSYETDDSYNSSDFEFISETEAKMAGIVINHGIEKHEKLSQASSEPVIFCFDEENHQGNEESDPGEGPSRQNRPRDEFEDRSYRNNHHVPVGDDYLGLFQGIYNPLMPISDILFLENKSVRASAMNMQFDGIGFDKQLAMRRHQPDSSEDEFEDEAKDTAKKIFKMYPGENRKRRRRYL